MADLSILAGSTSQSIDVDLYVLATGAPQTGLVFNSSGLTAAYSFTGQSATATAITLATLASVNSAYSSGGFKEIDATLMPGSYRLDIPNAALAASHGRQVAIAFTGFSGMATRTKYIELTGWDNQDGVHGGMSSLPNTACTTNASLLTSGTGTAQLTTSSGQVIIQAGTGTGQLDFTSGIVKANATQILGTAVSSPATPGILDVNVKNINNSALNTSSAQIGVNVVNVNGQTATAAAGVTFPATIASSTNITGGTITTVTNLTNAPTNGDLTSTMKASVATAALTTQMTESYAADNVAPTLAQALFQVQQFLGEFAISGTTITVKKLDGSTSAATYTLNDATTPTSITRAS